MTSWLQLQDSIRVWWRATIHANHIGLQNISMLQNMMVIYIMKSVFLEWHKDSKEWCHLNGKYIDTTQVGKIINNMICWIKIINQAWMGEVDCILSVASDENKTHL